MLPASCLLAYVEVAAVYATQRKHLNVALTAVGLQWSIGDHLKTRGAASDDAGEAGEAGEALARQAGIHLPRSPHTSPDLPRPP